MVLSYIIVINVISKQPYNEISEFINNQNMEPSDNKYMNAVWHLKTYKQGHNGGVRYSCRYSYMILDTRCSNTNTLILLSIPDRKLNIIK